MTLTHKRMLVLAAFGFTLAILLFPVPIAAWYSILVPAEHHAGAWAIISRLSTAWAHGKGYLPWRAWTVLFHHPSGLLVWLVLMAVWSGMFAYMGRDRRGLTSDWGGPPAAGAGQYGTARWRTVKEMAQGFELWQADTKEGYGK